AERIADLYVGDVLADHVAQRPVAVEVADLADEIRAPALAHAGLETVAFVVGGQAVYALGQARQHHVFAADAALGIRRRRDGDVAVVEARTGHHAETVQRAGEQVQGQRGGQFQAAKRATFAVVRRRETAGGL